MASGIELPEKYLYLMFSLLLMKFASRKTIISLTYVLAAVAIGAVFTSACAGSGSYSIRVVNGTSDTICGLYTREAHSYSRLSKNYFDKNQSLMPGEEVVISGLKEGRYDVEAEICNSAEPGYGKADIHVGESLHPTWIIGQ